MMRQRGSLAHSGVLRAGLLVLALGAAVMRMREWADGMLTNMGSVYLTSAILCLDSSRSASACRTDAHMAATTFAAARTPGRHNLDLVLACLLAGEQAPDPHAGARGPVRARKELAILRFLTASQLFKARGDLDTAQRILQTSISLDNTPPALAYFYLGEVYFAQRRYLSAIAALGRAERASAISGQLPNWRRGVLHYYLADSFRAEGDWESAVRHYRKVVALYPASGWPLYAAHLYLGDWMLASGDVSGALAQYELGYEHCMTAEQCLNAQKRLEALPSDSLEARPDDRL